MNKMKEKGIWLRMLGGDAGIAEFVCQFSLLVESGLELVSCEWQQSNPHLLLLLLLSIKKWQLKITLSYIFQLMESVDATIVSGININDG